MENIKEIFASFGLWSLVEDVSDDGDGIGDDLQLTKEGLEAHRMIEELLEEREIENRMKIKGWKTRWEEFKDKTIFDTRVDTDENYPEEYNVYLSEYDTTAIEGFISQELDKAREEGYQKGWEDGSKGKVFEKIEVETEVTFKDLRDVIEGKEDAGEFLSKLTTK